MLIIGGAVLAAQASGLFAEILVMVVAGVAALAIVMRDIVEPVAPDKLFIERQRKQIYDQGKSEAYRAIIAPISDPIILVENARVIAANPAAENVLGNHIVGEDVRIAIRHPAAADRLANPDTKHSGEPILLVGVGSANQRWELRIHRLDNGLKLLQLSDQSSHYASERMRTDFVANASHELRTPIAAIKGFVETLENPDAGKDDDTRGRFLKIMHDEADRMQRLVEDLMSLSRIEAEKYQLPEEPLDLAQLITETKQFFVDSRGQKQQDIVVTLFDDMPKIIGDRAQLSQLLHNLVGNAFKYGNKGVPVKISVEPNRSRQMLRLAVSNEGEGIAPEHLPRLTERFYRVDKGRSKAIGGTGLGLAIVKHITERHGGRMEITSEKNIGTTVTILLPIIKSDGVLDPPQSEVTNL